MKLDTILEKDLLPDVLLRIGIRYLLRNRLRHESFPDEESLKQHKILLAEELSKSPVAVQTEAANEQHYEVPASFYSIVLGPWLKYSSSFWLDGSRSLQQSEEDMLDLTIERAEIEDGQQILDLGCGWGSFTLYAAQKFPNASIIAVSNSHSQKQFIESKAKQNNLYNVKVFTADINEFDPKIKFDRIVSVEMFEHVRNYNILFDRIHGWLKKDGKLFVHIFNHRKYAYKFEAEHDTDWMAKYFFSGGMMPSRDFLLNFSENFKLVKQLDFNGKHYAQTLETWLQRMDDNKDAIMEIFSETYGKQQARKFWSYWRIFFMACAETFSYNNGNEWGVSHYLFKKA